MCKAKAWERGGDGGVEDRWGRERKGLHIPLLSWYGLTLDTPGAPSSGIPEAPHLSEMKEGSFWRTYYKQDTVPSMFCAWSHLILMTTFRGRNYSLHSFHRQGNWDAQKLSPLSELIPQGSKVLDLYLLLRSGLLSLVPAVSSGDRLTGFMLLKGVLHRQCLPFAMVQLRGSQPRGAPRWAKLSMGLAWYLRELIIFSFRNPPLFQVKQRRRMGWESWMTQIPIPPQGFTFQWKLMNIWIASFFKYKSV